MNKTNCRLVTSKIPFLVLSIIASFSKLLELFISFDAVRRCAVYTSQKKYNELVNIVILL